MNQLFISGQEIIIVFLIALLFFGAKSIPELARMVGKGMNEFRKATGEIQRELSDTASKINKDISDLGKNISDEEHGMDNRTNKE
jgi:sec-independent protein translocase protein TatA